MREIPLEAVHLPQKKHIADKKRSINSSMIRNTEFSHVDGSGSDKGASSAVGEQWPAARAGDESDMAGTRL